MVGMSTTEVLEFFGNYPKTLSKYEKNIKEN